MNNLDNCGDSQLGEPKKRPADGNQESDDNSNSHDIQNWIYPEDGLLVGTDAIFTSSPNVIPHHSGVLPHKRMGVPTPSIYTDERGEIHNIKANNKRINILYTKAGYLRSGDLHPNEQCDFIFSGRVKIWTLQSDGRTKIADHGPHDFIRIPRGVPHVFEFVEDTVLAEWWEPPGYQAWFYKPYRDIVNKKMTVEKATSGGDGGGNERIRQKGLEILVPVGDKKWNTSTIRLVFAGAFVGVVGFAVGRRNR